MTSNILLNAGPAVTSIFKTIQISLQLSIGLKTLTGTDFFYIVYILFVLCTLLEELTVRYAHIFFAVKILCHFETKSICTHPFHTSGKNQSIPKKVALLFPRAHLRVKGTLLFFLRLKNTSFLK